MADVFVSFDYDNDRSYKFLLEAWHANPRFSFTFGDHSSKKIHTESVSRVKAAITPKINSADVTLVIIGRYANKLHLDHEEIGYKNWLNWEIAKSKQLGKPLVGVKLDRLYESPEQLLGTNTSWAMSFTEENVIAAISKALSTPVRGLLR